MRRVIVFGASGNLGLRLVRRGLAHGHAVTAFVRHPDRLEQGLGGLRQHGLTVLPGDAFDAAAVTEAVAGHDAVVSAAGHVLDGAAFSTLFKTIAQTSLAVLGSKQRLWFVGGLAALTVPHTRRVAATLVGMPAIYRHHVTNWQLLKGSGANWSMMCPGPMVPAANGLPSGGLILSKDELPYDPGLWVRFAPPLLVPLAMVSQMPLVTVTYEDVAEVIMTRLDVDDPFCRARIGVAKPRGTSGSRGVHAHWIGPMRPRAPRRDPAAGLRRVS
jgi:uncharacterized protein